MDYVQEIPTLPQGQRSVITLGKFNGVHRGHQKLIGRVREIGKEKQWKTVIVSLTNKEPMLLTKKERRIFLESMGLDMLVDCVLDKYMMHMTPERFVKELLVDKMSVAAIVVGPDFRFGYQRKGNTKLLKELGETYQFQVEVLEKEKDANREISSTYIREQLNQGNIAVVNRLLGYPFSTTGEVLHGRGLGNTVLGVPTTNLKPPREKLMPPNGVYITQSYFSHKTFWGITNVGYKPSVGAEEFLGVETYLFDCDEDLYGQQSKVEFYKFLRPEKKFSSLQLLKEQLDKDIEEGRKYVDC